MKKAIIVLTVILLLFIGKLTILDNNFVYNFYDRGFFILNKNNGTGAAYSSSGAKNIQVSLPESHYLSKINSTMNDGNLVIISSYIDKQNASGDTDIVIFAKDTLKKLRQISMRSSEDYFEYSIKNSILTLKYKDNKVREVDLNSGQVF